MGLERAGRVFARLLPILLAVLGACSHSPAPLVPTPTASLPAPAASATAAQTPHAAEIKFALVGSVTDANVWALFDSKGYSYNNYAVRSAYYPRLYHLTVPDGKFEPQAAAGMPSPVQQEGAFFTATVPLRSDLKWTDGSPFTADDVAFTVNTALSFQLGFDWHAFYDPTYLDHSEGVDAHTVKFFFKKAPNVAAWQYGALQGPVVQKAYWSPKISASAALLPTAASMTQIDSLTTQVADLQKSINSLIAAGATATGEQARQLQSELQNQQSNLDGLNNALTKAHAAVDGALDAARQSLYVVDATNEPTLGTWSPAGASNGTWVNAANPAHPFASPNFDRSVYIAYPDEASAAAALKDGKVNAILEPDGVSAALAAQGIAGAQVISNQNSSVHFLVINPANAALFDPMLRLGLYCAVDRLPLAGELGAIPVSGFIPAGNQAWSSLANVPSCGEGYDPLKSFDISRAVSILKSAGYSWATEPTAQQTGVGFSAPDGQPFPSMSLLAPAADADPEGARAAQAVAMAVQDLGISVSVQPASPSDIRYALFNDHKYDMALAGWRLSIYPGYLCDWFGDGNPFGYNIPQVSADCASLSTTTDLDKAQQLVTDIQSVLAQDLPFIPLYSGVTYDLTRGVVYPFKNVLNGLSGVYGAPDLAIPASP